MEMEKGIPFAVYVSLGIPFMILFLAVSQKIRNLNILLLNSA